MCPETANTVQDEDARRDEVPAIEVLELRADEVIEVARAAQALRNFDRGKMIEIRGRAVPVRSAVEQLRDQCCNPRLIAGLMLHAADHPDWAWVNFYATFCPEMNMREIARLRKTNISSVKYWLNRVEIPWDVYDYIPENR